MNRKLTVGDGICFRVEAIEVAQQEAQRKPQLPEGVCRLHLQKTCAVGTVTQAVGCTTAAVDRRSCTVPTTAVPATTAGKNFQMTEGHPLASPASTPAALEGCQARASAACRPHCHLVQDAGANGDVSGCGIHRCNPQPQHIRAIGGLCLCHPNNTHPNNTTFSPYKHCWSCVTLNLVRSSRVSGCLTTAAGLSFHDQRGLLRLLLSGIAAGNSSALNRTALLRSPC